MVGMAAKVQWPQGLTWVEAEKVTAPNLPRLSEEVLASVDPASVAILQFSSGSTGDPKGVQLTHRNLAHDVDLMHRECHIDSESMFGFWVPQFHDLGLIGGFLNTIRSACRAVVMDPMTFLQNPENWLRMVT